MDRPVIYTIGHSTHSADYFLELLQEYNVSCVVDIRSVPASAYNPQYNQKTLSNFLQQHDVLYLHLGKAMGAIHTHPDLLDTNGQVDFEKVRQSAFFKEAIQRLWDGTHKGFTLALMCAEREPLDCHRFSMVSVALQRNGFEVRHIMKDKTVKSNAELENMLLKKYEKKLPLPDMFKPHLSVEEQLAIAYKLRNKEMGYAAGKDS